MKPELLLFLRLYADNYALNYSIYEMVLPVYLKLTREDVFPENYQPLLEATLSNTQINADAMFRTFLEFLERSYPDTFVSEDGKKATIAELIEKMSRIVPNSSLN